MKVCKACGSVGEPKKFTPGSFLIEVVLWLCMFVPGLIYSLWRLKGKREVCKTCGSADLVPLDSPMGARLAAEFQQGAKPEARQGRG
jgi:hypothetical protein